MVISYINETKEELDVLTFIFTYKVFQSIIINIYESTHTY